MAQRTAGKKEKPRDARGTTLRIARYLGTYRLWVALLLLGTLLSNLGNLLGPTFAGKAIGAAVDKGVLKGDQAGRLHLTDDNLVNLQMLANLGLLEGGDAT